MTNTKAIPLSHVLRPARSVCWCISPQRHSPLFAQDVFGLQPWVRGCANTSHWQRVGVQSYKNRVITYNCGYESKSVVATHLDSYRINSDDAVPSYTFFWRFAVLWTCLLVRWNVTAAEQMIQIKMEMLQYSTCSNHFICLSVNVSVNHVFTTCLLLIFNLLSYLRHNSLWSSHLMEQRLAFFVKRHHVSLSCNPLDFYWAPSILRQSCTPSASLTTSAWSAVQLSCSTFEHPLWDALPRPHGVPYRGHRVWTQQSTRGGRGGGGGKMKHTQVTL